MNSESLIIRRATADAQTAEALADVTLDCVDGGASIGFMLLCPRCLPILPAL